MITQGILLAVINLIGIFLSVLVYRNNHKKKLNICFILMMICMLFWVNFSFLGYEANNIYISEFYFKTNFAAVLMTLMMSYIFFVIYFLKSKYILLDFTIITISSILVILTMLTDLIISGVQVIDGGNEIIFGNLSSVFNIFGVIVALIILVLMSQKYFQSSMRSRIVLDYFFAGIIFYAVMNVIFNVIIPMSLGTIEYSWIGDYSLIVFLILTGYTIISHGLFDIKKAVLRSVTYLLVVICLSSIYILISFVISKVLFHGESDSARQTVIGLSESLIMIIIYQPVFRFFNKITDKLFYKDHYDLAKFFGDINKSLMSTADLRSLLEKVSAIIQNAMKSEQCFFFVYANDDKFVSDGTDGHNHLPKYDIDTIKMLNGNNPGLIIQDRLEAGDHIRRIMISHRIDLILPLIKDDQTVGFLCLGESKIDHYATRDYDTLKIIANSLVVAIQNALAVHEVKELNASLQQKISNATKELRESNRALMELDKVKDDFISLASHQLRTPLTSIKGFLSMVLEGDVGKINREQKEMLGQAFSSSERMVRLINDFLNVSRLQTGKFVIDRHPADLVKIIDREIDNLQSIAASRGLKYVFKKPKNFPIMNLDEEKIRQVVMNFADNAMYYSKENSKIEIKLKVEKKEAVFTVKDTGIGVPKNEQSKLFGKFFRATNARKQRPDGTGVGLYLSKKIIEAHGGKIVFESEEGKGSTFGFRLKLDA